MLSPTDASYIATKKIMRGEAPLKAPFKECVERLRAAFPGVSILNAHYERIPPDAIPRLTVVVEYDREQRLFIDDGGMYDRTTQEKAAAIFRGVLKETRDDRFDADGLFVIFSDFEGVARIEANAKVTETEIERLRRRIGADRIWAIRRMLDAVDVFFLRRLRP